MYKQIFLVATLAMTLVGGQVLLPSLAAADTAAEIDRDATAALDKLYAVSPAAAELSKIAKGVLIFPSIVKGGLIIGGQYGKGALRIGGKTVGYYNSVAVSYGLQAGAQSFGYAMFFTTQSALDFFKNSEG